MSVRLEAITLDFGNTLVAVPAAGLRAAVRVTAGEIARLGPFALDDVLGAWDEERARQFREELPRFREVDLAVRAVRVLARLRGFGPPPPDESWDDLAAARQSDPAEAADVVGAKRAGWRAAYLDARPADSPLPRSARDASVTADFVIGRLGDLEAALGRLATEHGAWGGSA